GKRKFSVTALKPSTDFGIIRLDRFYKSMEEVVVTEAPVKINGDTIAFRADAFKTKPNATVEDLIKKLPGMQVDRDGTVKAQGEEVQKVYVDGKEFFSNDPKLATKNLTADMVDQVEVFDDMSEQAKFNRIDDGSRSKALNLKLKKDKKKGLFGKAYAGYGTRERYDVGLNANMFKGATQTSVIAKANNTNNIGFSFSDMIGMFGSGGGFGSMMGRGGMNVVRAGTGGSSGGFGGLNLGTTGSGITKSSQFGINYRDTWSKYFDVNGSYFFNHVNTDNDRISHTTNFFPDSSTLFTDDRTRSGAQNDNHRFNLNMVYTIDSFNSIIYNPNLSYQRSYNTFSLDSFYITAQNKGVSYPTNEGRTFNNSEGDGYNWTNNLIWRRRFRRAGRTLSVNLTSTLGQSQRDAYTMTNSKSYDQTGSAREEIINKLYTTDGKTKNYGVSMSYTEPLARDKILELNYSHNNNRSSSDRKTHDFTNGKYTMIDSLRNDFENQNEWDRFGTNLRVVKKKYNYQLGFAVQQTTLESDNVSKKTNITQKFTNLFPTASFNYQFARSRSLRFNYRGSTRQPSTTQLQNIVDSTNYRNLYEGNPALKQEFNNNFSVSYNFFDIVKFRNLFAYVTFSSTKNKIANSITQKGGGVQYTKPVNLDGAFNLNGTFNMGFPIKKMKGGNFNTNTRIAYNRDVNMLDNVKNFTNNLNIGEDLRLSYNYKEKLDLGIGVSVNYNSVKYTVQAARNTSYYTHTYSADITYTLPAGFILSTDFDYTLNTGRSDGFNQNYAIWNGSLAKELFKTRRGEIKLSVFDMLEQNQSVVRNIGSNYVEDVQSSVLNRFFMLTFTYKLNRMGGRAMPAMMERATKGLRITQ
ncbi:MAG TPA: outer membrane beta-barrel protein, partial [Flavisolibacter sp.]|nr:outer membrane beta-barrel protein [Flavisolibacter sp.]